MADVCPLVAVLTFAYGACLLGTAVAFLIRTMYRQCKHTFSVREAGFCALLPLLALTVLAATSLQPARLELPHSLHYAWHSWAAAIHGSPNLHNALHVGHYITLSIAIVCMVRMGTMVARMLSHARQLRALPARRMSTGSEQVFILNTSRPMCFVQGFLSPRIYVSSGLIDHLPRRECNAMLAHETAHLRRRDDLWSTLFMAFYYLIPLPGGWKLYREWQRAAERACDAYAARAVGDPCDVASALVEVTSLMFGHSSPIGAHFTNGEDVEGRVQALLDISSAARQRSTRLVWLGVASLAIFFLAETWLQHLVELFVYH